jgi:hypothetical protein
LEKSRGRYEIGCKMVADGDSMVEMNYELVTTRVFGAI